MVKILEYMIFFSLQNSQISKLLQECSLQSALRWKSAAFNCRWTLFNNIPCLPWNMSPCNNYWKRKHASLHPASTLGKKRQTWKLQNISGTNEVASALAPPTHRLHSIKGYTPAHRGGGRAVEPHTNHILLLRSMYPLYMGVGKQEEIQGKQFIWQSRQSLDATFSALSEIA